MSASKGDDASEGTQDAPVATLVRAIELAEKKLHRVYACNETWSESLVVPGHVSLHGGFDCASGWAYVAGESARAMLVSPGRIGMKLVDGAPTVSSFLTDFHIESADASEPGSSSFGLFVAGEHVPLTVRRCDIYSGNGAPGLKGEDGDTDGSPAAAGAPGNAGANACSAPVSKGGVGVENACEGGISKGGAGGDSGLMTAANGSVGEPSAEPPAGEGGLGEQASPACTPGKAGAPGLDGESGLGGKSWPFALLEDDWVPLEWPTDGAPGAPGQGGGGGGATFGSAAVCGAANPGGAAGGSGGAGGCGGKAGKGGMKGGGSFAIAIRSPVRIESTLAVAGNGGDGGDGGLPQPGGDGGAPGAGGAGMGAVNPGCAGGAGGKGGRGGWGGGGPGGSTVGLLHVPSAMGWFADNQSTLVATRSGRGGSGQIGETIYEGVDGTEADVLGLP